MYFQGVWGIDSLSVKAVESGELIRFSYRIVDPSKATVFNDSPAAQAKAIAKLRTATNEKLTRDFGRGPWSGNVTEKGVLYAMRAGRRTAAAPAWGRSNSAGKTC